MRAEHAFGELLGNVVRHAPGPVDIELVWQAGIPSLSVSDRGDSRFDPGGRLAPPILAECGRGLVMLGELGMTAQGTARDGGGTRMVVALPCRATERVDSSAADIR